MRFPRIRRAIRSAVRAQRRSSRSGMSDGSLPSSATFVSTTCAMSCVRRAGSRRCRGSGNGPLGFGGCLRSMGPADGGAVGRRFRVRDLGRPAVANCSPLATRSACARWSTTEQRGVLISGDRAGATPWALPEVDRSPNPQVRRGLPCRGAIRTMAPRSSETFFPSRPGCHIVVDASSLRRRNYFRPPAEMVRHGRVEDAIVSSSARFFSSAVRDRWTPGVPARRSPQRWTGFLVNRLCSRSSLFHRDSSPRSVAYRIGRVSRTVTRRVPVHSRGASKCEIRSPLLGWKPAEQTRVLPAVIEHSRRERRVQWRIHRRYRDRSVPRSSRHSVRRSR